MMSRSRSQGTEVTIVTGAFSRVCEHNKWVGINMLMFNFDVTGKDSL